MPGTYIALRVHPESERVIKEFCAEHNIPVVYPKIEARRHVTLFSSENDDFSKQYECSKSMFYAVPKGWSVFPTTEGGNGLVLTLSCPQLEAKHADIAAFYNATDRFPEYRVHCTFSYDIGTMPVESLPPFTAPLLLGDEYCNEYIANWAAK
jgi:hypothetical protein